VEQRLSLITLGVSSSSAGSSCRSGGDAISPATPGPDSPGFSAVALAYNARTHDLVDAVIAEAGAAGGRIVKPGIPTIWGGYAGYLADPDGHLWEVVWNPHFQLLPDGSLRLPA
jgi:uncharacterized glyoxalase superfamily protein PhnB